MQYPRMLCAARAVKLLFIFFGIFLAGGTATATTTGILPGPETPLAETGGILDQLYGLSNLQRVDDDFDQIWSPAIGATTVQAKFASYGQDFGYIPDLNGDNIFDESYVHLSNVSGGTNGIGFGGPSGILNSGNVNFIWALDPSDAPLWTSLPAQNSDSLDHMVTWLITGGAGNTAGNYVIAWEDLPSGGDRDFNDLVVEVAFAPIPIPAAVWLFGSGLIALAGIARKRKAS